MKLYGLQKLTLLDFPERVACTVFSGGCDFRCPFCHNYELATGAAPAVMDEAAFFTFLGRRRGMLDGVAITGGEPCLHQDLPDFMRRAREMGFLVKLDTNGAHPDMLKRILDEKLADYIAMDIKNSPEKYAATAGVEGLDLAPVRESVRLLMASGTDYEFRTTCVAQFHEAADFDAIGAWIRGARRYFLQVFTDRDTVPFGNLSAPSCEDMLAWAEITRRYVPDTMIRGMDADCTRGQLLPRTGDQT